MSTLRPRLRRAAIACGLLLMSHVTSVHAQDASLPDDYILLTIFLKHDQSKNLKQLGAELKETGFWAKFPPEGIEVESWYVMMGIGQVVTLRVPPSRLREVNRAIELTGWGAFRTEFYPTYSLKKFAEELRAKAKAAQ
jgi:uncharacterized protein with GYD domain